MTDELHFSVFVVEVANRRVNDTLYMMTVILSKKKGK